MIRGMRSECMMRRLHGEEDEKKLHDEKKGYMVKRLPCEEIK